ncbi:MAG: DUF5686 and carboxypeptidase regulatory-like domain-containing protein, partial [Hymenobacteraceae bacterium]|nr:DUF5686 and carboxypeptidase regulatory-like domain-containing protein [Hymenobacteraceae bacterium]MDX5398012.1 DUF5686 and carboxypeptidase regulatory-like domain-containing protein [Hymenobacteraceae bacterium]MDX5443552.1 DUF5686 and carboxypeptidase regulatory-like domain-containing protein [Hymenobacteraceae bacterium]MDX5514083.1 DUF5686 and carboxypeptidase regulatory-like domain-containing protein [Hymenobacteraceae bacterium]
MKKLIFLFAWLCQILPLHAQVYSLTGTVHDAQTREPLAFVSIGINDGKSGTTTNVDGKFSISSRTPVQKLKISYLGYEPQEVVISSKEPVHIKLKQAEHKLQEVVIRPGENPAHRIIRNTTASRSQNDPANIASYTYIAYNKFYVTGEITQDTLSINEPLVAYALKQEDTTRTDSILSASLSKQDSSLLETYMLLSSQHIFMTESVSRHSYIRPSLSKEDVLATRVSGLKQPSFAILAQDSRAFSVYPNLVNFFGKQYLSPISEGSTRKYDFQIEDTTYSGADTTFIISFRPLKGKNFEGLKGQLHINSNGWAVENVIAESAEETLDMPVKLQQQFKKVEQQWFPNQVTTEIKLKNMNMDGMMPVAYNRCYISHVELAPDLKRREFKAVTIKLAPDAASKPETFWQQYRHDTLSQKELQTYTTLDSIGEAEKFDLKLRVLEILMSKKIPVGPVSLDMDKLLPRVNRYEGLRLGIGAHTNDKVSEFFSVGGYIAYGFKDRGLKYGSDLLLNLYKPSQVQLSFTQFEDLKEAGGVRFPFTQAGSLVGRGMLLQNFDKVTHYSSTLSLRTLKYLDLKLSL